MSDDRQNSHHAQTDSEKTDEQKKSYVIDQCFGWADEDCNECTEHCAVYEECLEARREHFQDIADELRAEDMKEDKELRDATKAKKQEAMETWNQKLQKNLSGTTNEIFEEG